MMKRNHGVMLYFGALCFVLYPLQYALQVFSKSYDAQLAQPDAVAADAGSALKHFSTLPEAAQVTLLMAVFAMTLLMGLFQFSYLHSKKAVDVYHSLPVSRDTLTLANVAAAFTTVMVPLAINYMVALVVGSLKHTLNPAYTFSPGGLLMDLLIWAILVFAVLAAIAFVAVQVGSVFDTFLFSCELLCVVPVVLFLTFTLFEMLLRGYDRNNVTMGWLQFTSPFTLIPGRYSLLTNATKNDFLIGNIAAGVWLLVGLLLLWLAIRIYRRRPSELAESNTANCALAQLGVLAMTYVAATFCGTLFSGVSDNYTTHRLAFVLWTLLFGVLAFVLAQVVLQRGVKGLRKAMWPGVATVGVTVLAAVLLATGGLGYESRIPAADDIESVSISYRGRYGDIPLLLAGTKSTYQEDDLPGVTLFNYDYSQNVTLKTPEAISLVQKIHTIASKRSDDQSTNSSYTAQVSRLTINYTLKNGRHLIRGYDSSNLGAAGGALLELENNDEFKTNTYPAFQSAAKDYASATVTDAYGFRHVEVDGQAELQKLLDAAKQDIAEENVASLGTQSDFTVCTISFAPAVEPQYRQLTEDAYSGGYLMVRPSYTHTLQALRDLGLANYMTPDSSQIASMTVYPEAINGYYAQESVITMVSDAPDSSYAVRNLVNNYYDDSTNSVRVTDRARMNEILKKSFTEGCPKSSPVTVVFFDSQGNPGGAALIEFSQLPQDIQDAMPEWVKDNGGTTKYSGAADAAAPGHTESGN